MIRRTLLALFIVLAPSLAHADVLSLSSRSLLTDYLQAEDPLPYMGSCQDRLALTEEDAKRLRDEMIVSGYFPADFGKNGGTFYFGPMNLAEQRDIAGSCRSMLHMVRWLEERGKQDADGVYAYALLEKINETFFLQLHQLLAQNDMFKDERGEMFFEALHEIYSCQVRAAPAVTMPAVLNSDGTVATPATTTPARMGAPFRTCLSKIFLVLSIINSAEPLYQRRKETVLLHLNEILLEMIAINRGLDVASQINEDRIRRMVTLIGIYHVKQPIMQVKTARNIAIIVAVLAVVAALLYFYHDWLKANVYVPFSERVVDPVIGYAGDKLSDMTAKAGGSLTEGAIAKLKASGEFKGIGGAIMEGLHDRALAPHAPTPPIPAGMTTDLDELGGVLKGHLVNAGQGAIVRGFVPTTVANAVDAVGRAFGFGGAAAPAQPASPPVVQPATAATAGAR